MHKNFQSPDQSCVYKIFQEIKSLKKTLKQLFSNFDLLKNFVDTTLIMISKVIKPYLDFWSPKKCVSHK